MWKLRENEIDESGFRALMDALNTFAGKTRKSATVDRLIAACLFEVPWEIENTVEHYCIQNEANGKRVSEMAAQPREAIMAALGTGCESLSEEIADEARGVDLGEKTQ